MRLTTESVNRTVESVNRTAESLQRSIEERKELFRGWELERKQRAEELKQREAAWEAERKQRAEEQKQRAEEQRQREAKWEAERKQREAKWEAERKQREKEFNKIMGTFTSRWGRLVEELCKPAALKLFKDLGIGIREVYKEAHKGSYRDSEMEIDIILCDTTIAIAVEVKTTCKVEDVEYFLDKMPHFKEAFHPFAGCTVHGAMAALKYDEGSDKFARRNGLFVIHADSENSFRLEKPAQPTKY